MSHYGIRKEFFNEAIAQIENRVVYKDATVILQLLGQAKPMDVKDFPTQEDEKPEPVTTPKKPEKAKQEVKL